MHSPTEPAPRAPCTRPDRRADARRVRHGIERPAAAGALLRPHLDDGAQRLRRADHLALSARPDEAPRGARVRWHAADDAVQRRRRDAGRDLRARGAVAALRSRGRADGRVAAARAARPARLHHHGHGRHELRRGAGERRRAARDGRRHRRPLAARAADDRHPHDRRGRRLDRVGSTRAACCTSVPQSAGAQPGPACYGRGGTQPTVTDADLVLGYLGEASFAARRDPTRPRRRRARARAARGGARAQRRGGRGRRLRPGQRDDGDRRARRERAPRPRSTRLPARRRRRRRARCTRRRSRASSTSARCSCRASRRSSARRACCCPTSSTTTCAPTSARSPAPTRCGCARCSRR